MTKAALYTLGLMLLIPALLSCRKAPADRPNIVVFLIDDFGYGDISFEENRQIATPNIDRIAREGARFSRFYQSSAACAPTRASLLTGRYHLKTGVWGVHYGRDFLHRDETTIADAVRAAGYATGAFGKWHSGKTWPYFAWNRGFDVGLHTKLYQYFDMPVLCNNMMVNIDGPVTDVVGDQVARFIRRHRDQPFFCYVPFQAIHEPFNCPDSLFMKYKASGYSDHVARAYGMIEVLDNNVGKIMDTLSALNLDDNTVIMFLSDDGPAPGRMLSYAVRRMNDAERQERERAWKRSWRGGKASIWEGGSITPFYIRWPGRIASNKQYDQLAGVIDIYPTVMDICGIEPTQKLPVDGRSLWPLLKGTEPESWKERMYFDNSNFYRIPIEDIDLNHPAIHYLSVHYKQYKLVRTDPTHFGGGPVSYELFDLTADPLETTDLYEALPELATKLSDTLANWYADILATGHAFRQAVYEVGNPEDPISPINLDALVKMEGSVNRSDRSEFFFVDWSAGSSMTFNLDVKVPGLYQVALRYRPTGDSTSVFQVVTNSDSALVQIDNSGYTLSDTILLQGGLQPLKLLQLHEGSDHPLDPLQYLLIHFLGRQGESVLLPTVLYRVGQDLDTAHYASATADFMTGATYEPSPVNPDQQIEFVLLDDNLHHAQQVEVFLDFESQQVKRQPPFHFSLTAPKKGAFTINLKCMNDDGYERSVYRDFIVRK
jgi:arylsulfatase A